MRGLEILPVIALAVSSCVSNQTPLVPNPEKNSPTPNILVVPSQTFIPTLTAEALIEELSSERIMEIISASQKSLRIDYQMLINGGKTPETVGFRMSSTLIDLGGDGSDGSFLIISAGHGFSWLDVDKKITKKFKEELNVKNVLIQNKEIKSISINDTIHLDPTMFELDFAYSKIGSDSPEYSLLIIPKSVLSPSELEQLKKDALPSNMISFTPPTSDQSFYGICNPEGQNLEPVVAVNARFAGQYENLIYIEPFAIKEFCSGSGVFTLDSENKLKLIGIVVQNFDNEKDKNIAIFYPLSNIDKGKFGKFVNGY